MEQELTLLDAQAPSDEVMEPRALQNASGLQLTMVPINEIHVISCEDSVGIAGHAQDDERFVPRNLGASFEEAGKESGEHGCGTTPGDSSLASSMFPDTYVTSTPFPRKALLHPKMQAARPARPQRPEPPAPSVSKEIGIRVSSGRTL